MANFEQNIQFVKGWEGGLSKATTDTASANPSPCTHKGETGWHTNKGIQWKTFNGLSPRLGYEANCKNFLTMPDDIWKKVYKNGFWDAMYADDIKSDAIANFLVEMAWGSGAGSIGGTKGAYPFLQRFLKEKRGVATNSKKEVIDTINSEIAKDEKALFNDIIDYRKAHLISLNQPANIRGWLRRVEDYRATWIGKIKKKLVGGYEFTKTKIKSNKGIVLLIIFLLLSATLLLIYRKKIAMALS